MKAALNGRVSTADGGQAMETQFVDLRRLAATQEVAGEHVDHDSARIGGHSRARSQGTKSSRLIGRPKAVFNWAKLLELSQPGKSWREIARACGVGATTVRTAYRLMAAQLSPTESPR